MSEQDQKKSDKPTPIRREGQQRSDSENPDSGNLADLIIESLCPGVVAFDRQLRIIQANTRAAELIDLAEYIDQSLAKGTDAKVWGKWTRSLKSAIATGQRGDFKAVRYNFDGRKRVLDIVCTPLKQRPTQSVIGAVMVIEDGTEKADIEAQLAQAERFAAVGKVASKVAHELNNPMDGILRYLNLAIRVIENQDLEKAGQYLQQCRAGLIRMVQIISELLEFSRSTCPTFESAPLDQIVHEAVKAMESVAGRIDIQVIRHFQGDMPRFRSSNLVQVFSNLIKNAADATEGAGKLTITIGSSDGALTIEFHDSGLGFAPENAELIFEPFFTTKGRGAGLGLGLAICKDIVEKYDGQITARNAPEGGCIFTVHLPLAQEKSPKA